MFLITPTYLKHGRQFIKDARKLVAYKRDLVSEETLQEVIREIVHLEHAVSKKDKHEVGLQMKRLDEACGKLTRPTEDAAWRENVEVFLVAIVIALAVRTFFLQPFTIPTGSMQPTLNGIRGYSTPGVPPPNIATQILHKALFWRTYLDVVAQDDETLLTREEVKRFGFFTYTKLGTSKENSYLVHSTLEELQKDFDVPAGKTFKKGEPIVQGYIDTGDHVFVDKISYHFMRPKRGQVFVFSTRDIPRLNRDGAPSQYYIKRLAGVPNDDLRIVSPKLFVNGELAQGKGFERVMSGTFQHPVNDYRGYENHYGWDNMPTPSDHYQVPERHYFALGDNSYNSLDGRNWGPVPQENIAGRALLVYYPFAQHLGWIW